MDPRQAHASSSSHHRDHDTSAAPSSSSSSRPRPVPSAQHHHDAAHPSNGMPPGAGSEPKKKRDPNMPKAVCNAYMIFCKSRRNELKYENPELPFGKIGAKLGEMWRNMSQEEKRPYDDRAAVDRERYRREMIDYTAGLKSEKRQKLKKHAEDEDEGQWRQSDICKSTLCLIADNSANFLAPLSVSLPHTDDGGRPAPKKKVYKKVQHDSEEEDEDEDYDE